jgi:hypothetical protein
MREKYPSIFALLFLLGGCADILGIDDGHPLPDNDAGDEGLPPAENRWPTDACPPPPYHLFTCGHEAITCWYGVSVCEMTASNFAIGCTSAIPPMCACNLTCDCVMQQLYGSALVCPNNAKVTGCTTDQDGFLTLNCG